MSRNQSIAAKKRWQNIPPEERTKIMRDVALKKHAKISPKDHRAHALFMNEVKRNKKKQDVK